jgi:hypothetical protein
VPEEVTLQVKKVESEVGPPLERWKRPRKEVLTEREAEVELNWGRIGEVSKETSQGESTEQESFTSSPGEGLVGSESWIEAGGRESETTTRPLVVTWMKPQLVGIV